jgi:hypothetical protein
VRGSLAISTLGCCGTSDRAPRRGPRVSKTTAQRVARVLAVVGIGRAATEVGGNWPANHAPREPGRQRTISSSSLAVPCPALPPLHRCLRPRARCPVPSVDADARAQHHQVQARCEADQPPETKASARSLARGFGLLHEMERYAADSTVGGPAGDPRLASQPAVSTRTRAMHG